MTDRRMSRRSIVGAGLLAASGALGAVPNVLADTLSPTNSDSRRALRFAHPTDIHVRPEMRGGEGMAAAFKHMLSLQDAPEMIITGGDLPMDTGSTPETESKIQWDLFLKIIGDYVPFSVPIYHTIGNHDVWGRDKKACKATGDEPHYGKKWFLQNFKYDRTWQSFDRAGWHFVILDSIDLLENGDDFACKISGEQMDWLKSDLAKSNLPTVVVSHAPIMSVANYFDRDDAQWDTSKNINLRISRMHVDVRELDALFQKHRNVRLCLSGHLHLYDRCEYNGVTYICDGAVCGAKWTGPKRETAEGYGLIDLFADGTFQHQYMTYGWKAV